ncbi:hypothetical protein ZWY2020_054892 [Hordeum vulgare]|nr:hypothetical protein ZWY2020_054892 [Hordeum vulgare]
MRVSSSSSCSHGRRVADDRWHNHGGLQDSDGEDTRRRIQRGVARSDEGADGAVDLHTVVVDLKIGQAARRSTDPAAAFVPATEQLGTIAP